MKNVDISLKYLTDLKQKLKSSESTFVTSEDMSIKYDISYKIIDKLSNVITELIATDNDLQKHSSTLRYALETLIVSELLIQEKDYFLKLYYAVYTQQVNKTQATLSRLRREIGLLKKYEVSYKDEILLCERQYTYDPILLDDKSEEIFQSYKRMLQNDIYMFLSQLEEYGFEYLIEQLEETILPQYIEKVTEYEELKKCKAKKLITEEWFKSYFGEIYQYSKVFTLLKDNRKWLKKAEAVGLKEEYENNYEMTSSLLHFTSYSLQTSNAISKDEKEYNYMIINQYIKKICSNLKAFSGAIIFDVFHTIKVK